MYMVSVTVNVCPGWRVVGMTVTALEGGVACAAGVTAKRTVASAANEDRIVVLRRFLRIVVISLLQSGNTALTGR